MYIANLPIYFAETNLENMFKDYGTVISTRILRKPDGISRGVGFSRMESKEKCERIIDQFNGKILPGNNPLKDECQRVLIRSICVFVFYKHCTASMQPSQIFSLEFPFKTAKTFSYEN